MLTIRLTRVGKKKDPSFRVVVVESKRKVKAGNYLEMVGSYDPRVDTVSLKAERIKHWIAMGATVSDTVHNILISQKIIEGKKINVLPKKTVPKKNEPAVADTVASTAATTSADTTEEKAPESAMEEVVAAPETATEAPVEAAADAGADAGSGADGGSGGGE